MSELCKYDEQVLDYLYEELAPSDRAAFAEHLAGCESCRRELASLSGVRAHVAELPKPELSAESAAKMKAQLMEAAIAATQQTKQSVGGGKIVQFPSGRVRRILTHPATAALTVAAAALFLVIATPKAPVGPVSDSPSPAATAHPAPETATTQVPVVDSVTASKPEAASAQAAAPGISGGGASAEASGSLATPPKEPPKKTGFFEGRALDALTRSREAAPAAGASPAATAGLTAPTNEPTALAAKAEPARKPQAAPAPIASAKPKTAASSGPISPVEVAQPTPMRTDQPEQTERFAPAPPPVAEPETVAQAPARVAVPQVAQQAAPSYAARSQAARDDDYAAGDVVEKSKQIQHKRTLEELERAELAQAPNQGDSRRYASTNSVSNQAGVAASGLGKDGQRSDDESNALVGRAGNVADKAASDRSAISHIYEQIKSGRCSEAQELIQKLERANASMTGLSELSATWQRDCGARNLIQNAKPMEQQNLPMPKKAMPSAPFEPRIQKMPLDKLIQEAPSPSGIEAKRSLRKPAPIQNQNRAPAKAKKAASDVAY